MSITDMATQYFVNNIAYVKEEPESCINCGRNDLVKNHVIAKTGKTSETATSKDSILCLACETLMVVADERKLALRLQLANPEDKVTLRSVQKKR